MSQPHQLVWVITGTSSGFGRDLVLAALDRGEKVIATARGKSLDKLDDLKAKGAYILELDVTDSLDSLKEVAKKAVAVYGRVDVLVNNAGYAIMGPVEENSPEETFEQFKYLAAVLRFPRLLMRIYSVLAPTSLALNLTRAFLPYMRKRKTGTLVFAGSIAGRSVIPSVGLYSSTKYAIRGISLCLHAEIAPLGLRSICIEFGYFRTAFLAPGHRGVAPQHMEDYREMAEKHEAFLQDADGKQLGDPVKGVKAILDVVRGEVVAKGHQFPEVLALGSDSFSGTMEEAETSQKRLNEWKEVSYSTDF
ncbi:NAD(P)-binding protein [Pluteus cervinus]|uniref:NAD(P)-binding protein n=1 Tax=Pluteus cervinus TaxID=181527 RepID=A0ACD3B6P8_9AGAR|nr:NAD(P)-binding protein [Pluteus cervinus]